MSLREFLAWWLRGLRATAVSLDEAMTGRRPRSLSDELERDIAELQALQSAHEPVRVCANCPTVLSRYNAAALCARCGSVTANVRAGRPPSGHRPTCGCLSCADWRAAARRLGLDPPAARDWRGVPL